MGLYNKIIDIQKLGQAWDRVKKNKPACGVDHITYEMFEERRREELKQLHMELAEHRYESLPVKLSEIYKGEKVRTIALFSMRDKVLQQSIALELSKIYEPLFSKSSYAYRPGQSALEAIKVIEEKTKGQSLWVLKMDIKDFFGSICHQNLLEILKQRIREQDVIDLIKIILEAKVLKEQDGELLENRRGIYQGSSCAPVLSNIYLMEYDQSMEQKSDFFIRYSDDILVIEDSEEKIKELYEYSKIYLEKIGLALKESKTKICKIDAENGFTYLGYQFTTKGRSVPAKAISSLNTKLERMWLSTGLSMEEKLKKGQEIIGGWEQYYQNERNPETILEYIVLLSMAQKKNPEILNQIEQQRFRLENYYKDIAKYMADYWKKKDMLQNAVREYEQFFQAPKNDRITCTEQRKAKIIQELLQCYEKLMVYPTEEICTELMQLYTDLGTYRIAAHFWEMKMKYSEKSGLSDTSEITQDNQMTVSNSKSDLKVEREIDIRSYMELFVGREDTYAREDFADGNKRVAEQVLEPLTEELIVQHLSGKMTLDTYVQRPNGTSKYMILDIDISRKILLQYAYESEEFFAYKQKAADYALYICKILRQMGISGYVEDSGCRGYHIWIFFTEWIPVRYLNRFAECIQKELKEAYEDIVVEFFPNNTRVRKGKMGQKIKLPLGNHVRTGKRSFFLDSQFCPVDDHTAFFSGIAKYSLAAIRKILGMYALEIEESMSFREVDKDLERFGSIPETVKIVLERCSLMRYLCQKAASTGYLSHFERLSILYVFAHMGEEGKEFVHTVMSFTLNYQYNTTQKFILKLPEKPISCVKLREQYKLITAEYGCSCNFKRTKNCYPSPVLHAIKNSEDEESKITVPVSRTLTKDKKEQVYEEINIHKQTERLAQKIVEQKRQRRGLDKAIQKTEAELQRIFDNAEIDCLEITMGLLVRRKKGDGYEWLIEL